MSMIQIETSNNGPPYSTNNKPGFRCKVYRVNTSEEVPCWHHRGFFIHYLAITEGQPHLPCVNDCVREVSTRKSPEAL